MILKPVALAKLGYYPGTYLKRQRKETATLTIVVVLVQIRNGYLQQNTPECYHYRKMSGRALLSLSSSSSPFVCYFPIAVKFL